jgi:hypothetical protein
MFGMKIKNLTDIARMIRECNQTKLPTSQPKYLTAITDNRNLIMDAIN